MSLVKQLWIGIFMILLLTFGGSLAISVLSAKHYLEDQLRIKNIDNANSLAMSLSQLEKDPVNIELLISAQFDEGHYEYIRLLDAQKNPLISREYKQEPNNTSDAPNWLRNIISFNAPEGIAQVQNGWQQYGVIQLKSHSRYALVTLWESIKQLTAWFVVAALFCGFIGTLILKYISTPLDLVIKQAEAIGERRFVVSDEPRTTEFQRLVRAMNALSRSVKNMLEKETKQLEKLRRESQLDGLTELPNRQHFLNLLESLLERNDSSSSGVLILIRVLNLMEFNNAHGRNLTDHALLQIAGVLHHFTNDYPGSHAGRLNGSDFMVVITGNQNAESTTAELSEQLNMQLVGRELEAIYLPMAACAYSVGEKRQDLLHKLDGALAQAELKGNRAIITLSADDKVLAHRNLNEWREVITEALNSFKLQLAAFPVKSIDSTVLHYEAPVRLYVDDQWQAAGYFMPWALRLGLLPNLDLQVVRAALTKIRDAALPIAINISADSLCNAVFREQAVHLLNSHPKEAGLLWIEFPESCALRHIAELRIFTLSLRAAGCKVGLEHVGLEFTKITQLQDVGLHYLKIDGAIIRDISTKDTNQAFIQGVCKIGQSLGMTMIAEGVNSEDEAVRLKKLGLDALTGPGIL